MNSLLFAIAINCTQQSAPGVTEVSAYNAEKTFKATLHLPQKIRWGSRPTEKRGGSPNPVAISLMNTSGESRFVYDVFWEDYNIYYYNVGKGPLGGPVMPTGVVYHYQHASDAHHMDQLAPGENLFGTIFPEHGWFFDGTPNGTYKVTIVYDDTGLWPSNMVKQRVGRIAFPLTMRVSNDSLSLVPRQPKRGEVSKPPELFYYPCQLGIELPNYMKYRNVDKHR